MVPGAIERLINGRIESFFHSMKKKRQHYRGADSENPRQQGGILKGQAGSDVSRGLQWWFSVRIKPTPRMVCRSFTEAAESIFFRKRTIWTSITLSSGVARPISFHTSRASIS